MHWLAKLPGSTRAEIFKQAGIILHASVEWWWILFTCYNSDTPINIIIIIIEMQIGGWERAFVARHVLQIYFWEGREERERDKKCAAFPQNFFFVFVSPHNLEE